MSTRPEILTRWQAIQAEAKDRAVGMTGQCAAGCGNPINHSTITLCFTCWAKSKRVAYRLQGKL